MKKKVILAVAICVITITVLRSTNDVNASTVTNNYIGDKQELYEKDKDNKWFEIYPLTPDDDSWKEIKRFDEMLDVCQIDQSRLVKMSTNELFDAVLNYPLLVNVFLYDTIKEGIENVKKQFNGMSELLQREDFEKILLSRYKKVEIPRKSRNDYNKPYFCLENEMSCNKLYKSNITLDFVDINTVSILESMLVNYCDLAQYTSDEKNQIVEEAIEKALQKENSDIFNYFDSEFVNEVMEENNFSDWKTIINKTSSVRLNKINNTYAIQNKSTDKITTVYVKTPNQTRVKCLSHSINKKNSDNFTLQQKKTYPNATLVGNGYSHNNCHAYAWTGRQDIYMDYRQAAIYKSDKSYKAITTGRPTRVGQKAVWGNFKHSGIVMDYSKQDPIITSKWGGGCIWRCTASYCPYDGGITYYKRNK